MSPLPIPPAVQWSSDGQAVRLLDQSLLPEEERWLRLTDIEQVAGAISSLKVRGAPAIGIAGAFGLALGIREVIRDGHEDPPDAIRRCHSTLLATRPTGRNLAWALDRVAARALAAASAGGTAMAEAAREAADQVAADEARMCAEIGRVGSELIPVEGARVLTHCNAGALATASLGTALAPLYVAHAAGVDVDVMACETRPILQGARLTAWELSRAGIPVTVVTDSMAADLMRRGRVDLVLVGADRIAANGDVANKIGTYGLAVLADHHGVPFYVAAPRSTFDATLPTGEGVTIECRDPEEVRTGFGRTTVPAGVQVWNPAFDVTPSRLVTALVTDGGILRPPYTASIRSLLDDHTADGPASPGENP